MTTTATTTTNVIAEGYTIVCRNFISSAKWRSWFEFDIFKTYKTLVSETTPLQKRCKLYRHKPVMLSYKVAGRGTINMYNSGKCCIVGCKSEQIDAELIRCLARDLKISLHEITFSHCMANVRLLDSMPVSGHLGFCKDQLRGMGVDCRYEPEIFPAIEIKTSSCKILLFHTGRMNVFGIRNIQNVIIDLDFLVTLIDLII